MSRPNVAPDTEGIVTDEVRATLQAGLRWLYETAQPGGALLQHHGAGLPKVAEVNRSYSFVPQGWGGHVVIVVDVVDVRLVPQGPDMVPGNPIRPAELDELAAALADFGEQVIKTWNGHPGESGSLALARPAHPSLLAAVNRYRAGCADHPRKSVFCGCGWFQRGYERIIRPSLVAGSVTPERGEQQHG